MYSGPLASLSLLPRPRRSFCVYPFSTCLLSRHGYLYIAYISAYIYVRRRQSASSSFSFSLTFPFSPPQSSRSHGTTPLVSSSLPPVPYASPRRNETIGKTPSSPSPLLGTSSVPHDTAMGIIPRRPPPLLSPALQSRFPISVCYGWPTPIETAGIALLVDSPTSTRLVSARPTCVDS